MKQESFDGINATIPVLTAAGTKLRENRKRRMYYAHEEKVWMEECLALMEEHGIDRYADDTEEPMLELQLVRGKNKIKVNGVAEDDKD